MNQPYTLVGGWLLRAVLAEAEVCKGLKGQAGDVTDSASLRNQAIMQ